MESGAYWKFSQIMTYHNFIPGGITWLMIFRSLNICFKIPLHTAAREGKEKSILALLNAGADVNAKNVSESQCK